MVRFSKVFFSFIFSGVFFAVRVTFYIYLKGLTKGPFRELCSIFVFVLQQILEKLGRFYCRDHPQNNDEKSFYKNA